MFAEERYSRITGLVAAEGRVSVAELATRFNITKETVRRDLALLEKDGVLNRVHGGAVSGGHLSTDEPSLTNRESRNRAEKMRIAKTALEMVPATGSVVIDAGTTCGHFAGLLASEPLNHLLVITHSVPIAYAIANSALQLELIGGRVRGLTSAGVGSGTVTQFESLRPDVAFIGANGIHAQFGLSTPDPDEASVKTAIVRSARRVVALIDSSKHLQEALVGFAALQDIDALITDREPDPELAGALGDADVEVVVA